MSTVSGTLQARIADLTHEERGTLLVNILSKLFTGDILSLPPAAPALTAHGHLSENDKRSLMTATSELNTYLTTVRDSSRGVVGIRDVVSYEDRPGGCVARIDLPLRRGGVAAYFGPVCPNRKLAKEAAAAIAMADARRAQSVGEESTDYDDDENDDDDDDMSMGDHTDLKFLS